MNSFPWVDEWLDEKINGYFEPILKKIIQTTTTKQKNILERLKKNSETMAPVYAEIEDKLKDDDDRRKILAAIVDVAVLCEEKLNIKYDYEDLKEVQKDIIKTTENLIKLLDFHTSIQEKGYLTSAADTHPLELLEKAGLQTGSVERQFLFEGYIKPRLEKIDGGLRMGKYMPRFQDVLMVLKREMEDNPISGCWSEVDAVRESRKTSWADFVRGFEDYIEQKRDFCGNLPGDFKLTNNSLAAIVSALFDKDIGEDSVTKARRAKR